ncbi:protein HTATIP2-like [Convolutriloba macropyga]|uniref:protein HTATIP2-like n=1 Tax=Convolutriloba macropyga TaxID=536237 RepID=UPI003F5267EA
MDSLKNQKAFVVGWTGACGEALSIELAKREIFKEVILVGRRQVELAADDPRSKLEQVIVDFEDLEKNTEPFKGCSVGYVTMGTTRRQVGAAGFVKVDYEYTIAVAKLAKDVGCKQLHYVSSQGANKDSCFLYTEIKGKVEHEMSQLGIEQIFIYRPALLIRPGKERIGEKVAYCILKPITAFKPTWNQIEVENVAKSIIAKSAEFDQEIKCEILSNSQMHVAAQTLC